MILHIHLRRTDKDNCGRYDFATKLVLYGAMFKPYITSVSSLSAQIFNLAFGGPCIVIYSYNESQRDALFLKFILIKNSIRFGQTYCPSSGVSTLYTQQ